ncbi:MAG: carbonic anhydrase [Thermodesulfobacteriota bacterium]
MRFCTVVNCIDGRVQLPVIKYLQKRFNVEYVDSVTEAGPSLTLSEGKDSASIQTILKRLKISIESHNSVGVAIAGHYGCAGNPASQADKIIHIQKATQFVRQHYKNIEIIGLYVDKEWKVHEVIDNKING